LGVLFGTQEYGSGMQADEWEKPMKTTRKPIKSSKADEERESR